MLTCGDCGLCNDVPMCTLSLRKITCIYISIALEQRLTHLRCASKVIENCLLIETYSSQEGPFNNGPNTISWSMTCSALCI